MSGAKVPIELIGTIAGHVRLKSDPLSMLRVSKTVYDEAERFLYGDIHLRENHLLHIDSLQLALSQKPIRSLLVVSFRFELSTTPDWCGTDMFATIANLLSTMPNLRFLALHQNAVSSHDLLSNTTFQLHQFEYISNYRDLTYLTAFLATQPHIWYLKLQCPRDNLFKHLSGPGTLPRLKIVDCPAPVVRYLLEDEPRHIERISWDTGGAFSFIEDGRVLPHIRVLNLSRAEPFEFNLPIATPHLRYLACQVYGYAKRGHLMTVLQHLTQLHTLHLRVLHSSVDWDKFGAEQTCSELMSTVPHLHEVQITEGFDDSRSPRVLWVQRRGEELRNVDNIPDWIQWEEC